MLFIETIKVSNPLKFSIWDKVLLDGTDYYVVGRMVPGNKIMLLGECDKIIINQNDNIA